MNLFQLGKFTSHSGEELDYKIECDALTDDDIECIAFIISKKVTFNVVIGVPTGGLRLANALKKYSTLNSKDPILIVDDVLTTGASMLKQRNALGGISKNGYIGFVIFSRTNTYPDWIEALLTMNH